MKKIIFLCLTAILIAPVSAMAVVTYVAEEIKVGTDLISTPSNNVSLRVGAGGDAYGVASVHASGTKVYASTSADTKIYQQSTTTLPLILDDTAQFSGSEDWKAM